MPLMRPQGFMHMKKRDRSSFLPVQSVCDLGAGREDAVFFG
jgi:hypothetical protein